MLTEVCGYLNNYFDVKRYFGFIEIRGGAVYCDGNQIPIAAGQYFALFRKNFVLGVYKYGEDTLIDKEFDGAVWMMDLPQAFMSLVDEIAAWQSKYGGIDSAAMSPFNSESFGGYSYTKSSSTDNNKKGVMTWQDTYRSRLAQYKKVSLV